MSTEHCAICGSATPFATTVHVMLNPTYAEGVDDYYVCRGCHEDHLVDLFAYPDEPDQWDAPTG